MKITGRINCQKKGALQFLGRSIYRAQDGESSLYFGVSREYMVGIFESWGENIKTGHVGLMPKLEDVHKEFVKNLSQRREFRGIVVFWVSWHGPLYPEPIFLFPSLFFRGFRQSPILLQNAVCVSS